MNVEKFNKFWIKKRLRMATLKVLEVKYHLSYDTIDCERDFGNHNEARNYILCVLKRTGCKEINSFNDSSLVITYDNKNTSTLFSYLSTKLKDHFYYSISVVAKNSSSMHFISHNADNKLNRNLQGILEKLSCDKY